MKRKIYSILAVLLIVMLTTTTAFAGGAVKLSIVDFGLGSLIASGLASGLGNTNWIIQLDAQGHAMVVCTNNGSNAAPGQNYPHTEGIGQTTLPGDNPLQKNGKSPFTVESMSDYETNPVINWQAGGCPNSNWTATVVFIFWDSATINAIDPTTNEVAATYNYTCTTTYTGPNATPSTFDDGTVSCRPK